MTEPDAVYLARRAREERDRADRAGSATLRRVHRDFAERYEERLRGLPVVRPSLTLV